MVIKILLLLTAGAGLALAAIICFGLQYTTPVRDTIPMPPSIHAEAVGFTSQSGAQLKGWFVSGRPGGGGIVLMHGIHANRLSMTRRALLFNSIGFSVLLFDFQAHGESTGSRITFGYREALDAESAVAWLRNRIPNELIGALGTSLGGAATVLGDKPLNVDALVIESVYPDIGSALASRLVIGGGLVGPVLAKCLLPIFRFLMPLIVGVNFKQLQPVEHMHEISAPLLLASGTIDNRTPIDQARALFEKAPEPKTFWPVEGAAHVDLEAFAPEEYRHVVLPFLVKHLQK